jgi:hypothetical protein
LAWQEIPGKSRISDPAGDPITWVEDTKLTFFGAGHTMPMLTGALAKVRFGNALGVCILGAGHSLVMPSVAEVKDDNGDGILILTVHKRSGCMAGRC